MPANEHCLGLGCRFAQIGETTVSNDNPRFAECEAILTAAKNADPVVVFYEGFVHPSVQNRERCGYAAEMILEAQGVKHA